MKKNAENYHEAGEITLNPLVALEAMRARLAIAIATESRVTPSEQRRYYMETADRMRRCLRRLRQLPSGEEPRLSLHGASLLQELLWGEATERGAGHLCRVAGLLIAELEVNR